MINGKDHEFRLTLNVSGFLVSGLVVSGHKYFEGFAEDFSGIFEDTEVSKFIKETYSELGDIYTQEKDGKEEVPHPNYIHLKNVKFYNTNGNPIPGNRGAWWRGRFSEISGFMLGTLTNENAKQINQEGLEIAPEIREKVSTTLSVAAPVPYLNR